MQQAAPSVEELFFAALELEGSETRSAYLDRHCSDPELRRRVEELLAGDAQGSDFLEAPASIPTVTVDHDSRLGVEEPGTVIGPYKLREQIGEGGMGVVYVAEQTQPVRRKVALKIIKPGMDSKQVIARFEAERQALAMMDHPNIAKVHDGGTTESGRPYFVMELVRGLPITEYCDGERLPIRERLELFVLVCRAVQHAHQKGIIHRDLKPSNILVTLHDGVPVPKVIDFGVAKAIGQSLTERTIYTAFAQLVGTPLYMSPEQVELSGLDIDTRSDIYALGVLLYELMIGTTPFDPETLKRAGFDEMRRIIREEEPPRPSTRLSALGATLTTVSARRQADPRRLGPSLRGELDWVVMKALEKDRRRRYETANDFAADVMRYLWGEPVQAVPPSAVYRVRKFVRRNRAGVAVAVVVALILAVMAGAAGYVVRDRAARVAAAGQRVAEALAGARAAIESGDLPVATQLIAEARGHLGAERESLPRVAARIDATEQEIEARQADRAQLSRFLKLASEAQSRMGQHRDQEGVHQAEEALGLYGVLAGEGWLASLEQSTLTPDQKRQVRETAYVVLVSLADFHVRWFWANKADVPQSAQRSLDLLRRAEAFHVPTRAFFFVRGECRQLQGNQAAADEDMRRVQATPARTAWDYYLPGHTAGWRGDIDAAIRAYRAALRVQPDHFSSMFFLARRLAEVKKEYREAIGLYAGCSALRPHDIYTYINRARCHHKLGQLEDAEADFAAAIAAAPSDPDRIEARTQRIPYMEELGRTDKVREEQAQIVALAEQYLKKREAASDLVRSRNQRFYLFFAGALADLGRLAEANDAYRKGIAIWPNDSELRRCLATVLKEQGQYAEAVEASRKAILLDPDSFKALNDLAWLLATGSDPKLRDPGEAVRLAKKAVELAPKQWATWTDWNTLGVAQYRAGDWNAARTALEKSVQLRGGGDGFDWFFLAMTRWRLGDKEQARKWFDRAAEWMDKHQPNNGELRRFRTEAAALLGVSEPSIDTSKKRPDAGAAPK
jgi:serine/threonine protein kinase/tetratricopeptide (TPR) repeat protein